MMYVLTFISLVMFVILALLALLKSPEIARNSSCLRHAIRNYLNWASISLLYCDYLKKIIFWYDRLICDSLHFYAHVHTSSPSSTDEE